MQDSLIIAVDTRRYRSHKARAQQGRGILIPASGQNMQLTAAVHIRVIRRSLNCNLPIELVYYGADDLDATAAAIIRGESHKQCC